MPSIKPLLSIPVAFWLLFAVLGVLQFAGAIDIDAFWYLNNRFKASVLYPDAEALRYVRYASSGFMGMDKPQLALWSSYVTCIAFWLFAKESGALGLGALFTPVLSVVVVLAIGSRQGLIGVTIAIICTGLLMGLKGMDRSRLVLLILGLATTAALGSSIWNLIDADRREQMQSQFEQLQNISSLDELVRKRDTSTPDLIRFIRDQPQRLYLGSGIGTESSDGQNSEGVRTYAEGEYLRILWSGGLISLACYIAILMFFLRQSVRGLFDQSCFQQSEGALLFSLTVVGAFFAFGQFHLFTTLDHNVPCNYLLMMVVGLLGGAVARSRYYSTGAPGFFVDAVVFNQRVRVTARHAMPCQDSRASVSGL